MSQMDQWRRLIFFGGLFIVALIINAVVAGLINPREAPVQGHPEFRETRQYSEPRREPVSQPQARSDPTPQSLYESRAYGREDAQAARNAEREEAVRRETEEAARKAQEEEAKRARYLTRYLNGTFPRQAGSQTVAIVVMSENGKPNNALATVLANHFKSETVNTVTTLFTPEFLSDGLFNTTVDGSSEAINRLELKGFLDVLVLAKQAVQYSRNPSLENTITANVSLDVTTLSITTRGTSETWSFLANGVGFNQSQARGMAEERLIKQLERDTKMSVNP